MMASTLITRQLRAHRQLHITLSRSTRYLTTQNGPQNTTTKPLHQNQKSWLTRKVETSPLAKKIFLGLTKMLGYGSPKQLAGRRAFVFYRYVCAVKPDDDRAFWQNDCSLPPTFQSWFSVTNLHIWMMTVRLRALPVDQGRYYTQALIDHFFLDIEDRVRNVLQPPSKPTTPYTFETPFYVNPNVPRPGETDASGKPKPRGRAPDRLVTRQMKIFKEQWAGMGMSLDLGLVKGDMEMAGAIWRNLLGARGARGIIFSDQDSSSSPRFRRSVNLVGGEIVNVAKVDVSKEETKDDNSGVHDFPPEEADKYVKYPELMYDIVSYVRRELARLEKISDADIISGNWEKLRFGRVREGKKS